jgi:hypothetical protein
MSCRQTSCGNWKDESFSIDYPENIFSISAATILEFFFTFVNRCVITHLKNIVKYFLDLEGISPLLSNFD